MRVWLGVSKSGYYEWRSNPGSATLKRREGIKLFIKKAFDDSDGTYGYRRVHAQLARWGVECGDELVRALMRELGLVPCQVRRRRSCRQATILATTGPVPGGNSCNRETGWSAMRARWTAGRFGPTRA